MAAPPKPTTDRRSDAVPAADARLARWRADTPGTRSRIHLNNAGAALPPQAVLDTIERYLTCEAEIGGYEAADESRQAVRAVYDAVGRMIGSPPRNVAVVENATVAIAQALSAFDFRPGDILVTTRIDYPSNQLMYLSLARRTGLVIQRADDLPEGGVDPDSVRRLVRHPRCRLVVLTWVPTNAGLVQDAEAVGAICEEAGVPYVVDACQSVGQMPVAVSRLRCDYLGGTARKFLRGPRGIGFLYVSDRALDAGAYPLYVDMHGADWTEADDFRLADGAQRFENWEFAYALVLGMGEAARYALDVGPSGFDRARALAADLRARLQALPQLRVMDGGREQCAIVTVAIPGRDATAIKLALRDRRINTSVVERNDGVLDMDAKGTAAVLRLSPHYYNTSDEVVTAVDALNELTRG